MNISILSLFPRLYDQFLQTSLIKRAQDHGVSITLTDLFALCAAKERVDGPTFAPGHGMVIRPEVVERAITQRREEIGPSYNIFFSPHGTTLTQPLLHQIYQDVQQHGHLALFSARYEGMDARIEHVYADRIISIGNYVLMGGDLPIMVFLEGLLRYVPNVVGKASSVVHDSYMGPFVDYPEYTRPVTWKGITVPEVLRSGDHKAIAQWRHDQSVHRTVKHHFSWLASHKLTKQEKEHVRTYIPPHYLVLMHTDVVVHDDRVGNTSVTSIDIHDIARSVRTYGVEKLYIVTPLHDQQKIVQRLLNFWQQDHGQHLKRHEAMSRVEVAASLDAVMSDIEEAHAFSCLIGTSAHADQYAALTYYDQERVWNTCDAVVCLLGTARGLSKHILDRCDYVFDPIEGMTTYRHLSVRSAAAVTLDRWLGIRRKWKRTYYGIEHEE